MTAKKLADGLVRVRTRLPLHQVVRTHVELPDGGCGEITFVWATQAQFAKDVEVMGGGWWVVPVGRFIAAFRVVT